MAGTSLGKPFVHIFVGVHSMLWYWNWPGWEFLHNKQRQMLQVRIYGFFFFFWFNRTLLKKYGNLIRALKLKSAIYEISYQFSALLFCPSWFPSACSIKSTYLSITFRAHHALVSTYFPKCLSHIYKKSMFFASVNFCTCWSLCLEQLSPMFVFHSFIKTQLPYLSFLMKAFSWPPPTTNTS